MYCLEYSSQFKKDFKKITKKPIPDILEVGNVISRIQRGEALEAKYAPTSIDSIQPLNFQDDPFVGMWSDRSERQDSTTWVRQIRQQHWQR